MLAPDAAVLEVMQTVRERARKHISVSLSDYEALSIALMSGSVEAASLLDYASERTVRTDSTAATAKLALTDAEFVVLFGTPDPAAPRPRPGTADHQRRLAEYEALPESKRLREQLEGALTTTLLEGAQRGAWRASAVIRVAAQVALCRASDAAGCVSSVVGGMVRADSRRLDDLKNNVEDRGIDIMTTTQAMWALASSVA
jgi:hypothetical protein